MLNSMYVVLKPPKGGSKTQNDRFPSKICAPFSATRNNELKTAYEGNRTTYNEPLRIAGPVFSVELLNGLLDKM